MKELYFFVVLVLCNSVRIFFVGATRNLGRGNKLVGTRKHVPPKAVKHHTTVLGKPDLLCQCSYEVYKRLKARNTLERAYIMHRRSHDIRPRRAESSTDLIYAPTCCKIDLTNENKLHRYPLTIRLPDMVFSPALNNPESLEYKNLAAKLVQGINQLFPQESVLVSVEVTKFRAGSVLADLALVTKGILSQNTFDTLKMAIESGLLGGLKVAPVSDDATSKPEEMEPPGVTGGENNQPPTSPLGPGGESVLPPTTENAVPNTSPPGTTGGGNAVPNTSPLGTTGGGNAVPNTSPLGTGGTTLPIDVPPGTTGGGTTSPGGSPTGKELSFEEQCVCAHNQKRKAHGVPPVVWSAEVATGAIEFAKTLASEDRFGHDPNNRIYGENLYREWGDVEAKAASVGICQFATDKWYDEIRFYDFSKPGFSTATGHFTQVIWKTSVKLGAGVATSSTGKKYLVARYLERGNVEGDSNFRDNVPPPIGDRAGPSTECGAGAPNKNAVSQPGPLSPVTKPQPVGGLERPDEVYPVPPVVSQQPGINPTPTTGAATPGLVPPKVPEVVEQPGINPTATTGAVTPGLVPPKVPGVVEQPGINPTPTSGAATSALVPPKVPGVVEQPGINPPTTGAGTPGLVPPKVPGVVEQPGINPTPTTGAATPGLVPPKVPGVVEQPGINPTPISGAATPGLVPPKVPGVVEQPGINPTPTTGAATPGLVSPKVPGVVEQPGINPPTAGAGTPGLVPPKVPGVVEQPGINPTPTSGAATPGIVPPKVPGVVEQPGINPPTTGAGTPGLVPPKVPGVVEQPGINPTPTSGAATPGIVPPKVPGVVEQPGINPTPTTGAVTPGIVPPKVPGVVEQPGINPPTTGAGTPGLVPPKVPGVVEQPGINPTPTSGAATSGLVPPKVPGVVEQPGINPAPTSGAATPGLVPPKVPGVVEQPGINPAPTSGATTPGLVPPKVPGVVEQPGVNPTPTSGAATPGLVPPKVPGVVEQPGINPAPTAGAATPGLVPPKVPGVVEQPGINPAPTAGAATPGLVPPKVPGVVEQPGINPTPTSGAATPGVVPPKVPGVVEQPGINPTPTSGAATPGLVPPKVPGVVEQPGVKPAPTLGGATPKPIAGVNPTPTATAPGSSKALPWPSATQTEKSQPYNPSIAAKIIKAVIGIINMIFNPKMADAGSEEFLKAKEAIEQNIMSIYEDIDNFKSVTLLSLSDAGGSKHKYKAVARQLNQQKQKVNAEVELSFLDAKPNQLAPLEKQVATGQLGMLQTVPKMNAIVVEPDVTTLNSCGGMCQQPTTCYPQCDVTCCGSTPNVPSCPTPCPNSCAPRCTFTCCALKEYVRGFKKYVVRGG